VRLSVAGLAQPIVLAMSRTIRAAAASVPAGHGGAAGSRA
jgi:hypothetical protein